MKISKIVATALCLGLSTPVVADGSHSHGHGHSGDKMLRADGHAPIGVMGDHRHAAGEIMFS
ncbi:MAG: transporter, partial [Pseudomonadota bacterium]